jgi:hypothetical protein
MTEIVVPPITRAADMVEKPVEGVQFQGFRGRTGPDGVLPGAAENAGPGANEASDADLRSDEEIRKARALRRVYDRAESLTYEVSDVVADFCATGQECRVYAFMAMLMGLTRRLVEEFGLEAAQEIIAEHMEVLAGSDPASLGPLDQQVDEIMMNYFGAALIRNYQGPFDIVPEGE